MRVRHIKSGKEGVVVGLLDSRVKVRYDSGVLETRESTEAEYLPDAGKCNQSKPPMSQSGGWYCTAAPDKDGKSTAFHAYYVNMEAMKMTWFEKYNTLADAIKDISKAGWNSGNHLFRQGFIITDNERKIVANGIYISNPNLSDDPVLFWVMVDKGVVGMISKDYAEQISGL